MLRLPYDSSFVSRSDMIRDYFGLEGGILKLSAFADTLGDLRSFGYLVGHRE